MERCSGHDQIVAMAVEAKTGMLEHGKQLDKVFVILSDIKETVDQNTVRAEVRDRALLDIDNKIKEVDKKIENGLRSDVRECAEKISTMMACLDARKKERIKAAKTGFRGWLVRSWYQFQNKAGVILIAIFLWYILLFIYNTGILKGGPLDFLKLFKIG